MRCLRPLRQRPLRRTEGGDSRKRSFFGSFFSLSPLVAPCAHATASLIDSRERLPESHRLAAPVIALKLGKERPFRDELIYSDMVGAIRLAAGKRVLGTQSAVCYRVDAFFVSGAHRSLATQFVSRWRKHGGTVGHDTLRLSARVEET